jgi:hypothetical protein
MAGIREARAGFARATAPAARSPGDRRDRTDEASRIACAAVLTLVRTPALTRSLPTEIESPVAANPVTPIPAQTVNLLRLPMALPY